MSFYKHFSSPLSLPTLPTILIGVTLITGMLILRKASVNRRRNPSSLPHPPGPKGLPIVGNLLQLPQKDPWIGFDDLCKKYGDLVYMEAAGLPILLLGSLERVVDLMDRRSAIWSSRGEITALKMMNIDWILVIQKYGPEWRSQRRTFHQQLNMNVLARFQPIFDEEIPNFLKRLSETPDAFLEHTRDLFGYAVMRLTYGSDDPGVNRQLLQDGKKLVEGFSAAVTLGRYLVNDIPFLRFIPEWFPGAGFKKECNDMKLVSHRVLAESFELAKNELQRGLRGTHPSVAASLIESMPDVGDPGRAEYIRVAERVCGVAYAAGADTTNSALSALFLALAMHPEVQVKAQRELDSVVGTGRLPRMEDKDSLPYVSAIVKELARWHTPVPIVFHTSTQDDEYEGYFLPKGTWAAMNIWALLHDPNTFPEPLEFNPDRFMKDGKLDTSMLDPSTLAFGYGRRICPGRYLADRTIFLVAACLLSTYNIYPAKDEAGNPIPLKLEILPGESVVTPLPFKCDVRLRSPQHAKLFS